MKRESDRHLISDLVAVASTSPAKTSGRREERMKRLLSHWLLRPLELLVLERQESMTAICEKNGLCDVLRVLRTCWLWLRVARGQ